ncbi:hypothetical protein EV426DRAFT_611151 [Tirmania nivea]|nr:hypothetical protein EV426DRAFT_611151 [Tirmania nivea]
MPTVPPRKGTSIPILKHNSCPKMKLLSALVLAIPFVIAAPVPDAEGDVPVAPASATTETTLPIVAPEDGSKPIDAVGKKGVYRVGDQVYPSKEALTEALKKKSVQPLDGQYPYVYDYYGYLPQAYPAVAYDYGNYPYYVQDPYAADYAAFYKAQKEQADYEQALKEYEYKKYLYDTDQTHLRPDLFPEHQVVVVPKQQETEQQVVQVEKPEPAVVRQTPKPVSQYKPTRHEQAPYNKYQFTNEEVAEPAQIDQHNFYRPEHSYTSNFNTAPVQVDDRKFQAQPQKIGQPQKQTSRTRVEELPENRNTKYIKQNEDSEAPYFPAESAYYPKAADKVIPLPPTYPAKIERTDVYPDVNTKSSFRSSNTPSFSAAANAANPANARKESEAPPREREREREPRIAVATPSQVQNQYQRPSLNQYQRSKPEVLNNNFSPAPAPYQHNQQYRPSNAPHEGRIGQVQVYPGEATGLSASSGSPSGGSGVNPVLAEEKAEGEIAGNANFAIFNRDTLGKRILEKHGYLDDTASDWVVSTAY